MAESISERSNHLERGGRTLDCDRGGIVFCADAAGHSDQSFRSASRRVVVNGSVTPGSREFRGEHRPEACAPSGSVTRCDTNAISVVLAAECNSAGRADWQSVFRRTPPQLLSNENWQPVGATKNRPARRSERSGFRFLMYSGLEKPGRELQSPPKQWK